MFGYIHPFQLLKAAGGGAGSVSIPLQLNQSTPQVTVGDFSGVTPDLSAVSFDLYDAVGTGAIGFATTAQLAAVRLHMSTTGSQATGLTMSAAAPLTIDGVFQVNVIFTLSGFTNTNFAIPNTGAITSLSITDWPDLATIDVTFGGGASCQVYAITNCAVLTSIVCPGSFTSATSFSAGGNMLSQFSVDAILAALDVGGVSNGSVDLSGGSNSPPTDATHVNSLISRGWNVFTN